MGLLGSQIVNNFVGYLQRAFANRAA